MITAQAKGISLPALPTITVHCMITDHIQQSSHNDIYTLKKASHNNNYSIHILQTIIVTTVTMT